MCAATISTGASLDRHLIPSMNWYHRGDERYVEYGSSFSATRAFGIQRSLTDTVYNLNLSHLSRQTPTVFEALDDADVRTAGTTYLIYRGRHRHEAASERALGRLVTATILPHAVYGPRELFYADLFASRRTGCRGSLGMPGARDEQTGCIGAYLIENDLFDFLLFSLPDNDSYSHRRGPHAQVASLAVADRQLERLMDAAGGPDAFLDDHAVILVSDHSHSTVEAHIDLGGASGSCACSSRTTSSPRKPSSPCARRSGRRWSTCSSPSGARSSPPRAAAAAQEVEGVDLVLHDARAGGLGVERARRAALRARRRLRRPARRGAGRPRASSPRWARACATGCSRASITRTRWRACGPRCAARPRATCCSRPRPGGSSWTGAGRATSAAARTARCTGRTRESALLWCGTGPAGREERAQWTIEDVDPDGARALRGRAGLEHWLPFRASCGTTRRPCPRSGTRGHRATARSARIQRWRVLRRVHLGTRKPGNWLQLDPLRDGRRDRLHREPGDVRAAGPRRGDRLPARPRPSPSWSRSRTTSCGTGTGRSATCAATARTTRPPASCVVSVVAFGFNLGLLSCWSRVAGMSEVPAQAIAVGGRDAAELRRQQALELPQVKLAAAICAAVLLLLAPGASAQTQGSERPASAASRTVSVVDPNGLTAPRTLTRPPKGHVLSGRDATAIAALNPKIRAERERQGRGVTSRAFMKGSDRWQVSYYKGGKEIAQVLIDDRSGSVLEAWTGFQVAWSMARGYPGAFGRKVNAWYVWIPLCVLFVAPFVDPRRPFRLLHLDLLVLVGCSRPRWPSSTTAGSASRCRSPSRRCSTCWCGCCWRAFARGRRAHRRGCCVPWRWLLVATIFLIGFRVTLNVDRRQRDRRRLLGGDRRQPPRARQAAVRRLPEGQPARRHLRAGQLLRLRARSSERGRGAGTGTTFRPRTVPRSGSTC